MIESTPSRIRCTAVGLGHNACFAVIGGLTPLVAAWLVGRTADEFAPAYLIMAAASVSFFRALGLMLTLRAPLTSLKGCPVSWSHIGKAPTHPPNSNNTPRAPLPPGL